MVENQFRVSVRFAVGQPASHTEPPLCSSLTVLSTGSTVNRRENFGRSKFQSQWSPNKQNNEQIQP